MWWLIAAGLVVAAVLLTWLNPRGALRSLMVLLRAICGMKRRALVIDGHRWTYLDSGPGRAPVMLLIHGFGADKDTWLPYARLLRARFRVIAPDLPGFGESPPDPTLDYSVAAQSERLHEFARRLGLREFHIAGNSLGGFISAWYALTHPTALRSLMLIDSAGIRGQQLSEADQAIDRGENPFVIGDLESFEKMMSRIMYRPPKIAGFIKKAMYEEMRVRQAFLQKLFWKLLQDLQTLDLLGKLDRISTPTLILWGREDRLVNVSAALAIHEHLPGSTLVILDEVGHVPMFEAPRVTAMHHERFIDRLQDGRPPKPSDGRLLPAAAQ